MITALLLVLRPTWAWDRIAQARRSLFFILVFYLFPLLVLTSAAEAYGLVRWGHVQGEVDRVRHYVVGEAVVFEAAELLLWLVVVLIGAALIKSIGETFHARHAYRQAFAVAAYGLGPLFLVHLWDTFSTTRYGASPWVTWSIGIILSISALYHGVPKIMEPDPPSAFGLYLMSAFLLLLITGLARFLTVCYLQGRFVNLQETFSRLGSQLPF